MDNVIKKISEELCESEFIKSIAKNIQELPDFVNIEVINEIISTAPVLKEIYSLLECGVKIKDYFSKRKILTFFKAFCDGDISKIEINRHFEHLSKEQMLQETSIIIIHLERIVDCEKSITQTFHIENRLNAAHNWA